MTDRLRRAFVAVGAAPGNRVELDPDEAHHVAKVLRLKRGDPLKVFDGAGREWTGMIDEISRGRVTLVVGAELSGRIDPTLRVVLFQAVVRPEKLEWVLQKGTEVGVAAFRLITPARVEAPPPSPARLTRYARILLEACKQSGRRTVPGLAVGELETPGQGVVAIVLAQTEGATPLGTVLAATPPAEVWVAVGPEGGFTPDELAGMAARGWRVASLGPRVLRTETAGAIAAAVILHRLGDLGSG